jgi:hypothetical protein
LKYRWQEQDPPWAHQDDTERVKPLQDGWKPRPLLLKFEESEKVFSIANRFALLTILFAYFS